MSDPNNVRHLSKLLLLPAINIDLHEPNVDDNIVGVEFMFGDKVYCVVSVKNNRVHANNIDNIQDTINLSCENANELIDEYL